MIYYIHGIPYSDELYHYGIPKMSWGHRRFQDKFGRLTELGKIRYGYGGADGGGGSAGTTGVGRKPSGGGGSVGTIGVGRDRDKVIKDQNMKYATNALANKSFNPIAAYNYASRVNLFGDLPGTAKAEENTYTVSGNGNTSNSAPEKKSLYSKISDLDKIIYESATNVNHPIASITFNENFPMATTLGLYHPKGSPNSKSYIEKKHELSAKAADAISNGNFSWFSQGGSVNLDNRPVISSDRLADAGYNVDRGSYSAIEPVSTTLGKDGQTGVTLTPILQDGNVIDASIMSDILQNLYVDEKGSVQSFNWSYPFQIKDILVSTHNLSDIPSDERSFYMEEYSNVLKNQIENTFYIKPQEVISKRDIKEVKDNGDSQILSRIKNIDSGKKFLIKFFFGDIYDPLFR